MMLHIDDMVFAANTLEDVQKLIIVLDNFCMLNKLSVNSSKMKVMLVNTLNKPLWP